jgi:UDP-2,3-diacylglucosamine pyrophosphatase LpxH
MKVTRQQEYTHSITIPFAHSGDSAQFLLLSDIHIDNPKCDRALLKKHLEQAKAKGAGILVFGDLFCAMQGKYDKRANKEALRPEHRVVNYFDALVDTTAEYLKPYAENILLITPGNHETAILKNHETDLTTRLALQLGCEVGAYAGWVRMQFRYGQFKRAQVLSYHHGYGGGGPVTRDVIQTARKAVYLPDADIVVSGHTHDRWIVPVPRVKLLQNGIQTVTEQLHLKLGTYKDEYTVGHGWAIEKGFAPKSLGGVWLSFNFRKSGNDFSISSSAELA